MSVTEAIIYVIIGVLGIFFLAVLLTFLNGLFCKKHNKKLQILLRHQPSSIQRGFIAPLDFSIEWSIALDKNKLEIYYLQIPQGTEVRTCDLAQYF